VNPLSQPQPLRIDVGGLARKTVASLYSHLVTRPTGRAVRLAIESQLAEAGEPSVSLVDFSQVTILDFSCADEVVARLLRRYEGEDRPRDAFFVLRGVQDWHEEPIQVVLERQALAAVTQDAHGTMKLLGVVDEAEREVWDRVEATRSLHLAPDADGAASTGGAGLAYPGGGEDRLLRTILNRLVARRLVFRQADGHVHALSHLLGGV